MLKPRLIYCVVVLAAGCAGIFSLAAPADQAHAVMACSQLFLAVLTYPTGVLGTIVQLGLVYSGAMTPEEAMVASLAVYLVAGYLQWFGIFPCLYRKPPRI